LRDLSEQYNNILDEGASITELFVYHLIITDERSYGLSEKEIRNMVEDAINARYNYSGGLESIVDSLLNGDELNGDEDIW
jgi:hypothetical protein